MRSPASIVRAAATSWAWIGSAPNASAKAALPKVWSKCSWVFTTPTTRSDAEPAYVLDHLGRREPGRVGVDDDRARASPR